MNKMCKMSDMKWFILVLLAIFAMWYMNSGSSCGGSKEYSSCGTHHKEHFKYGESEHLSPQELSGGQQQQPKLPGQHENPTRCMNQNWVSSNLLPKNDNIVSSDGFEFAPKVDMQNMNFLDSKAVIGVDTQTSSLRNANVQLRSEPPNPKTDVSPWLNSTIEPDLTRRPLE